MRDCRQLILRDRHAPGDVLMLTSALRDLHLAYPGKFCTEVLTDHSLLLRHNPYITHLQPGPGTEELEMHYPAVETARAPWTHCTHHFCHAYRLYLEQQLQLRIPQTELCGDVYLGPEEQQRPDLGIELPDRYWILNAGWKPDFTCKAWPPEHYLRAAELIHRDTGIHFVQTGTRNILGQQLQAPFIVNAVGRTGLREFMQLMNHADGVITPVSFPMHLSAAMPWSSPGIRPCVVIAGGRENPVWEQYPGHAFLHTCGRLDCCAGRPCWMARTARTPLKRRGRSRKLVPDPLNDKLCSQPQKAFSGLYPACMLHITPEDVHQAAMRLQEAL